jgi:ankyrin repeat protein
MKSQLIAIVAAVLVVGCGESQSTEPPTAKAPAISFHEAAKAGDIEAVKRHLAAGTDVNAKLEGGVTSLHFSADIGHKEIAKLLIAKGADVNARDFLGMTPLDMAASDKQMFENAKGGDEHHSSGLTLVEMAAGKKQIRDLLRKHGGKYGSIHTAAADGDTEAVKEFLATGVDVNAKSSDGGQTPLHLAIPNEAWRDSKGKLTSPNNMDLVELLITKGADVNAKSDDYRTPVDEAKSFHHEIADLLRKHGGKTGSELPLATLHEGVRRQDLQGIKDFLAKGADVNAKSDDGRTPLDEAKFFSEVFSADWSARTLLLHNEIVDLLRKHGGKTAEELKAAGN